MYVFMEFMHVFSPDLVIINLGLQITGRFIKVVNLKHFLSEIDRPFMKLIYKKNTFEISFIFWNIMQHSPLEVGEVHGIISQKKEVFTTIFVRTSKPTKYCNLT
jgi:hypothetical protein